MTLTRRPAGRPLWFRFDSASLRLSGCAPFGRGIRKKGTGSDEPVPWRSRHHRL